MGEIIAAISSYKIKKAKPIKPKPLWKFQVFSLWLFWLQQNVSYAKCPELTILMHT